MTQGPPAIAITSGEPAGIGPELCAMLASRHGRDPFEARLVVFGDRGVLAARAARIGLAPRYANFDPASFAPGGGVVEVCHEPLAAPPLAGHPDPTNGASVLAMLRHACDACADGAFAALVTAPVQKSAILDAGLAFVGHTEYFAERTGTPRVVMMLVGGASDAPLRVALVTTHLALADVPAAVTREAVRGTLAIVHTELARRFGIAAPRIAVCGLNPHAGEGGHLGREEIDSIVPAIADARAAGIDAHGPLPADTVFVPSHARGYDAIVAMYHDQGLPVLKAASFGLGVNVTLGLPFPRTSVDHGTALDLAVDAARARTADPGSLVAAVELAIALARASAR
ncbi:MAG TPA: 4-hydroxythreonine-4-phosphate dehydrogenase PdxA [Casimicrobiaceae bacterium]|jgi:4-hydroxythreonine-4-phosphate dehydrogenase|nr:4-hydroxythreonine-4-phosphate dehydrogenase PdxA [Casimicrobiaceae bacterium]